MAQSRRAVKGAGVLTLLAFAAALGSGCDARARRRLPELPRFTYQNEASIRAFREAAERARASPRSAREVAALGMLLHAYQFLDEARICYRLARELDPDEFRWIYYRAQLEKSAFNYEAAEASFRLGLELRPEDAELWAELGDLYLKWSRPGLAREHLERALALEPLQPVAALGRARLAVLDQDWPEVVRSMERLIGRYPRLSKAHQYLAAAYGALGDREREAQHQEKGEYGAAVESERMDRLNELAVAAILDGDPRPGAELLKRKCARCHDHERIYEKDRDRRWWARTVRRMQREAGWQWLADDEAASVVALLAAEP